MATPTRLSWMQNTYIAEGCDDLPAHVSDMDGQKLITTAWTLTPAEHASVTATGLVVLQCVGFQPPVNVGAVEIEQPAEARFNVGWIGLTPEGVPQHEELRADTLAEAMTLVLSAAMKDAQAITIERL
jgi:hypothetical protein